MMGRSHPKNPYVVGVPLTGKVGFYGRRDTFRFVESSLDAENQNVMVLYGQRRVGKTSLLHQLAKHFEKGTVQPVYFDLQGMEQRSLGEVLEGLARAVARALKMGPPEKASFENDGRHFHEAFLPSVYSRLGSKRLLLLFDEFDVLGDELTSPTAASETLFPYLQELIMHEGQLAFIFVVGRRIEELTTHFQAIFKQAVYRRVGLLKSADARDLIVKPVKGVISFEEGAIEGIISLTAGHPYFTQLICSEIFNAMKTRDRRTVNQSDVMPLVDQAIESGHGALTWFWDGLPRAERFIMSAVAHVSDESGSASKEAIRQILEKHRVVLTGLELTDAPDRLVEWEMLSREGPDNYRFVVELVRRWIIKTHSLENARRDVDFISRRAVRLYENAREAHIAGDLEYARGDYQRALDANPNHSGAQLGLAQVLFELGQIEESIEEFIKSYALDDMSARDGLVRARLALAKKLESEDRRNEAVLEYEQALQVSPTDETVRRRLAFVWIERGNEALKSEGSTTAAEHYRKALDCQDDEVISKEIKSRLEEYVQRALDGQNFDEKIRRISQLRELFPEDRTVATREAALWAEHGNLLANENEGVEAIKAYKHALELDPENPSFAARMAEISAECERLLEIDRLFNQGKVAQQDGDWPTAKESWKQLIIMDVFQHKGWSIADLLSEVVDKEEKQRLAEPDPTQTQPDQDAGRIEYPSPEGTEADAQITKQPSHEQVTVSADHPDIVIDRRTGLMWTRKDNGKNITWQGANDYAKNLRLVGFADWRLPTIDELESLYDPQASAPYAGHVSSSIDRKTRQQGVAAAKIRKPFHLSGWWVWSSTRKDSDFVWGFDFSAGQRLQVHAEYAATRALCVRRFGE